MAITLANCGGLGGRYEGLCHHDYLILAVIAVVVLLALVLNLVRWRRRR